MPLCAFQVQSVRKDINNNEIQITIVLEECDDLIELKTKKNIQQQTRPRVT